MENRKASPFGLANVFSYLDTVVLFYFFMRGELAVVTFWVRTE